MKISDCIKNRRLFEAASGIIKLEDRERGHIHECRVCQGVLHVFIRQHTDTSTEASRRRVFAA
jgi:hypothetical protein